MRGKNFLFNPIKWTQALQDQRWIGRLQGQYQPRLPSTIPDPSKSVEDTSRDIAKIW